MNLALATTLRSHAKYTCGLETNQEIQHVYIWNQNTKCYCVINKKQDPNGAQNEEQGRESAQQWTILIFASNKDPADLVRNLFRQLCGWSAAGHKSTTKEASAVFGERKRRHDLNE